MECSVCGLQHVGSTFIPLRLSFNNNRACNRRYYWGGSFQGTLGWHFPTLCGEGHRGLLKDATVAIIDTLNGSGR